METYPKRGTSPVVGSKGSWFGQVAILSLFCILSYLKDSNQFHIIFEWWITYPSHPQPDPWTPTVIPLKPENSMIKAVTSNESEITFLEIFKATKISINFFQEIRRWFTTVFAQICPENAVINMSTTIEFESTLEQDGRTNITFSNSFLSFFFSNI